MKHDNFSASEAYRSKVVSFDHLLTTDSGMREVLANAKERASVKAKEGRVFLLSGETGTGKNLLAQAIHSVARKGSPFVVAGPGDLLGSTVESILFGHAKGSFTGANSDSDGLIRAADGGTLFLDDLLEYDEQIQAKLLNFVEYGKFRRLGDTRERASDVLIILGILGSAADAVKEGRLRSDLYYRANGKFHLPPLRERGKDSLALAKMFAKRAAEQLGGTETPSFSEEAMEAILVFPWPGNLRELKNTVRSAVELRKSKDQISMKDLGLFFDEAGRPTNDLGMANSEDLVGSRLPTLNLKELRNIAILQALDANGGNRTKASKVLGIGEATLYRHIKDYGLE